MLPAAKKFAGCVSGALSAIDAIGPMRGRDAFERGFGRAEALVEGLPQGLGEISFLFGPESRTAAAARAAEGSLTLAFRAAKRWQIESTSESMTMFDRSLSVARLSAEILFEAANRASEKAESRPTWFALWRRREKSRSSDE